MYSYSDLAAEIRDAITNHLNGTPVVPADWIVNLIVQRHMRKAKGIPEYFRYCALAHTGDEVRKAVNRAKRSDIEDEDEQLVLPGYHKLQVRYAVVRDGKSCFIRLEAMTDEEIVAKANECYRMARGCEKHGDELMDYFQKRASRAIA